MKLQHLTAAEALASLKSAPAGLAGEEAARRLREFGPNRVEEARREHLLLRLGREFTHFFAVILWIAAGLAFFAEASDPGQGMGALGAAVVGVILVNGGFSFWQEHRAEKAIEALKRLLPQQVRVLRDGETLEAPAEILVPGDIVLLQDGDRIPADCRVIAAAGLRINCSTVTGESLPRAFNAEPDPRDDPLHARNLLLAGTTVVSGEARAVVFATGMRTEFGRIAHLTQTAGGDLSPLQKEIRRLSRVIAALATVLGVGFFAIGQAMGLPFWSSFIFGIGIIVANVPEGLLPTVTLSLALATQRMARRNALVRHLPSVETLGSTSVICTDKTGTLTVNRMTARHAWIAGRMLDGEAIAAAARSGTHPSFFAIARHCHGLREVLDNGRRRWSGDPMEVALVSMAAEAPAGAVGPRVGEVPFDTDRRRMSILHGEADAIRVFCKGAPEQVLPLCTAVEDGEAETPLTDSRRAAIVAAHEDMASRGLRVLALAHRRNEGAERPADPESGLVLAGLVGLEDPPRAEVPAAIRTCGVAGIKVIMVTGDHPRTAVAIAREIGLVTCENPQVVTGDGLRRMTPAQLQLALDAPEILFARVGADQKMHIVEALRRKGHVVAATGDGVNDAPALKAADIGISMGISGTDVAKEAADLVLLDDNFASIVAAVEEGRAVYDNIRKFLTYILTSNIPEVVPYLAFALFRIPLPLTVIQILAVDLGTDMLPALALGAERPDPEVMRRPPRPRDRRLLDGPLLARAYLFLGGMEAVAAMAAFFFVLQAGGWQYGEVLAPADPLYQTATTACLAAIIVMQVANVFLCRHPEISAFDRRLARNPLLYWGIGTEIVLLLAVVYTPVGNLLLGTAPLPLHALLFALPLAAVMVAAEELRKAWVRHRHARRAAL